MAPSLDQVLVSGEKVQGCKVKTGGLRNPETAEPPYPVCFLCLGTPEPVALLPDQLHFEPGGTHSGLLCPLLIVVNSHTGMIGHFTPILSWVVGRALPVSSEPRAVIPVSVFQLWRQRGWEVVTNPSAGSQEEGSWNLSPGQPQPPGGVITNKYLEGVLAQLSIRG